MVGDLLRPTSERAHGPTAPAVLDSSFASLGMEYDCIKFDNESFFV